MSGKIVIALVAALMSSACGSPTALDRDIEEALEAELRSVAGEWVGLYNGQTPFRLDFRLQEGSNGQLSGSGTMTVEGGASAVPITVTGTFRRPTLSLTFEGMVYEGQTVQGTVKADYISVAGIFTRLQLTGSNYSKALEVLLQEKS